MADTARINELLSAAASAHHGYEQDELGGERDEEWAEWYADHALENDLADALGTTPSSDEVVEVLIEATADHEAEGGDAEWSEFTAQRLVDRLA